MPKFFSDLRFKSIAYNLLTVIVVAIGGALTSPDFLALLQEHTGTAFWGTALTLVVAEVIKHIRNKLVVAGAQRKGYGVASASNKQALPDGVHLI